MYLHIPTTVFGDDVASKLPQAVTFLIPPTFLKDGFHGSFQCKQMPV
jgi:hypothetical protein